MTTMTESADLTEAQRIRQQARHLLTRLIADKANLEAALSGDGRRDHLKTVTGRSSLDNAIAATQRMIETIDRALATRPSRAVRLGLSRATCLSPVIVRQGAVVGV